MGPMIEREVMDVREAAKYLGVSRDALLRYAAKRIVPGFKLGNRWRFTRTRLNRWMEDQEQKPKDRS